MILYGHGVTVAGAYQELTDLAERADIPVISTLQGLSAFPTAHRLSLGMPGMHGGIHANHAINESDVLIAIGMRFDDRVTGSLKTFARNSKVIHIDIDPAEIGKNVPTTIPIVGDVKNVLQVHEQDTLQEKTHHRLVGENRRVERARHRRAGPPRWTAEAFCRRSSSSSRCAKFWVSNAVITVDVGQHQMWVAQHFELPKNRTRFISSGGLGTMGFGLPSRDGLPSGRSRTRPYPGLDRFTGDGGFQMNLQELATLRTGRYSRQNRHFQQRRAGYDPPVAVRSSTTNATTAPRSPAPTM